MVPHPRPSPGPRDALRAGRVGVWSFAALFGWLGAAADAADTPSPDTSGWKCAQCPFLVGTENTVTLGVLDAQGANAYFGRYTGLDHDGAYADAGAAGQARSAGGDYLNYDLQRLGLASREGTVEGGREGRYDLRVSYDGQPSRLYDDVATPYRSEGAVLSLTPGGTETRLGYERRTAAVLARVFASPQWTLFAEFRRQEKVGTGATSASFLTEAVQLPQPIDYVTDSLEAGAAWAGRRSSFRIGYTGSWFEDDSDALRFANPYAAIVPGSTVGALGQPPGNRLQQLAASGNVQWTWLATALTYTASLGTLRQNDAFLPVSTLPNALGIIPSSLDGDVRLSHYAIRLSSRPFDKLRLNGNATYDGRDDQTRPIAVPIVVTDTFAGGTVVTPRYGEDRMRLDGHADYDVDRRLRAGVGGQYTEVHFSPGQILRNTQDVESWARISFAPTPDLNFGVKFGDGLRKTSDFNAAAFPVGENPLVRAFNFAPRDRIFTSVTGAWAATPTLAWTVGALLSKDDYRSSPLGLQAAHEQQASTALTWTPRATLSAHANLSYQRLFTLQNGSAGILTTPWLAADTTRYWNLGVGGRWVPQRRWTLSVDYSLSPSHEDLGSTLGGLSQDFPESRTKLATTRFDAGYQWTEALDLHFLYQREQYDSNDWALNGVGPTTVANLLAFGVRPYGDGVNLFGLSVRYQFGRDARAAAGPR